MVKYSIIIPTLNGKQSLELTIKYILSINREDFEIIVSDNHSVDGTFKLLQSFNDPRLKIFQPPNKLPHSEHLNFAYTKATGLWINHIGDDDLIFNDRFEMLDELIKIGEKQDCEIFIGKSVRYIWPDNIFEKSNTINLDNFFGDTNKYDVKDGKKYYEELINTLAVPGGGEFVLKRNVYEKVVNQLGFFCPSNPHVEFFGLRAAAFFAKNILQVDTPFYINGRMSKSIGNALASNSNSFDWKFENPHGIWKFCPIETYAYNTISLDASLAVEQALGTKYFNKYFWGKTSAIYSITSSRGTDINNKIRSKRYILLKLLKNFPITSIISGLFYQIKDRGLNAFYSFIFNRIPNNYYSKHPFSKKAMSGDVISVNKITDLADYYPLFKLRFKKHNH